MRRWVAARAGCERHASGCALRLAGDGHRLLGEQLGGELRGAGRRGGRSSGGDGSPSRRRNGARHQLRARREPGHARVRQRFEPAMPSGATQRRCARPAGMVQSRRKGLGRRRRIAPTTARAASRRAAAPAEQSRRSCGATPRRLEQAVQAGVCSSGRTERRRTAWRSAPRAASGTASWTRRRKGPAPSAAAPRARDRPVQGRGGTNSARARPSRPRVSGAGARRPTTQAHAPLAAAAWVCDGRHARAACACACHAMCRVLPSGRGAARLFA